MIPELWCWWNCTHLRTTLVYRLASESKWSELKRVLQFGNVTRRHVNYHSEENPTTPLHYACQYQAPVEVVRLLLEKGAEVNALTQGQFTPLHEACSSRASREVIGLLLEKGAEVNARDSMQRTPLHRACIFLAPVEVVLLLLEKGADVHALGMSQQTPLHDACRDRALEEVVRLLLKKGAKVNALKRGQLTPLHCACEERAPVEVVRVLLAWGAEVNALDTDQRTPLHFACSNLADVEVVRALLERRADAALKDKSGKAPLDEENRPHVQILIRRSLGLSPSMESSITPPKSSITTAPSASSSEFPLFFLDLFAKASITDPTKQQEYAQNLLEKGIDSPHVLLALSKDDLAKFDILLGDAIRLLDACKKMNGTASMMESNAGASFQSKQVLDASKPTVMISYQWSSQPSALQVRDYLISLEGFNVIMDMMGVHGNFLEWMEESVQACNALIMLITPKYQESPNCRAEACRAHDLRKKIIPVTLDPDYSGAGWLAPMIAGLIRYDGSIPEVLAASLGRIVAFELAHSRH